MTASAVTGVRGDAHAQPLDFETIERTIMRVELALNRGNRNEALAAVNNAFASRAKMITENSSLVALVLPLRIINGLEKAGITTLCHLRRAVAADLIKTIPYFGDKTTAECAEAIAKADATKFQSWYE